MIAIVTYIEDIRAGGWVAFDRVINNNIDYTFGVDKHFYIARTQKDYGAYYSLGKGNIQTYLAYNVANVWKLLGPEVTFVNVQPPSLVVGRDYTWLSKFEHPAKDCCYVFGPNHGAMELIPGPIVSIDLEQSALYAFAAAAIVLYDRRTKL